MNALNYLLSKSKTTDSTPPAAEASSTPAASSASPAAPTSSSTPRPSTPTRPLPSASVRMPPSSAWSPSRAKIQLKLSIQRIRLLAAKKAQLAKVSRRDIAGLLEKGKLEAARIRCEGVMGEDQMVELLEVLELYCEVCLSRFGLLELVGGIDPGVSEAVIGIIHAAPRTELKELHVLREMLMSKGGREFTIAAVDNKDGCVPSRITDKLVVAQPPPELVDMYLYEIAKAYSIPFRPASIPDPSLSSSVPSAPDISSAASALSADGTHTTPHPADSGPLPDTPAVDPSAAPSTIVIETSLPSPRKTPAAPVLGAPPPAAAAAGGGAEKSEKQKEQEAFDALTARFAALKKR